MKVILLNDQRHRGRRGDVVKVKPGYARNFLMPKGLAAADTVANRQWFERQRGAIEAKIQAERSSAAEFATRIHGTRIQIAKRAGEGDTLYGSVTPVEIVEALHNAGVEIDRQMVDLTGGIKALGEHPVRINLHSDVTAEITVDVVRET